MTRNSLEILKCSPSSELADKNFKMVWEMIVEESLDKILLIAVIKKLKKKFKITDFEIEAMI